MICRICGHNKEDHSIGELTGTTYCQGIIWTSYCFCRGFKPDNLSYLEQKYNEQRTM